MALPDPDGAETGHGDGGGQVGDTVDSFLQQSYLTYIIPFATHFSPEEALGQGEGSVESKIAKIEQRDQLFFGMRFARCSRCYVSNHSLIYMLQMRRSTYISSFGPSAMTSKRCVCICPALSSRSTPTS
jgi:hypothetical protein